MKIYYKLCVIYSPEFNLLHLFCFGCIHHFERYTTVLDSRHLETYPLEISLNGLNEQHSYVQILPARASLEKSGMTPFWKQSIVLQQ